MLIELINVVYPRTTPSVTINCAVNRGNGGPVHRARQDDVRQTTHLIPLCPPGAKRAEKGRTVFETTDRQVTCPQCLDILAGS